MWEEIKHFFEKDWSNSEKLILGILCFLIGVLWGFVWAPIKKGITIRSNNTSCSCGEYLEEE